MNIGLLGFGTVGTGVYEIIYKRKRIFRTLVGDELSISKILIKDINKDRSIKDCKNKLTDNPYFILDDPDIDIVIEAIGGIKEAYEYIKYALTKGKHVITANKAVVARHMKEFIDLANKNKRAFLYEASVAGGVPIVKPLKQQVTLNDIKEINSILNGTSNFILSKMIKENLDFSQALDIAQKLGYAEADPTDDIDGYDVRRKLAILSTIAFKREIKEEDIYCRGIRTIKAVDIKAIKELGYTVKLLAKALFKENNYYLSVEPNILSKDSFYAKVEDANNLVSITGNDIGELKFYGAGAGKLPTANAVVSDVLDIIYNNYGSCGINQEEDKLCNNTDLVKEIYYIRISPKYGLNEKVLAVIKEEKIVDKIIKTGENIIFTSKDIDCVKISKFISNIKNFINDEFYAVIR
ncbi:homoserine dehydrogenase [Clostridium sp. UBA4395]|uniref:homoserine dehydrogenase n=1 Tax=Clostridium sp. UBA4395 TaxID=1946360 RepID=UPI003216EB34